MDQYIASAGHPGSAGKLDARYRESQELFAVGEQDDPSSLSSPVLVEGRINNIVVSSSTGLNDLLYSMQTAPGTSGSAVANECGQIVGRHYQSLNPDCFQDEYNAGVAHPPVEQLLRMADIPYTKADQPCDLER